MGRLIRRLCVLVSLAGVGWAGPARAQEPAGQDPVAEDLPVRDDPAEGERKSTHYRSFKKIRTESMIRKVEETAPPDMRGEYEKRRDYEVMRHFTRLARLDAIAKVARDAGEEALASRVDATRRDELERFRLAMERLRQVFVSRQWEGHR